MEVLVVTSQFGLGFDTKYFSIFLVIYCMPGVSSVVLLNFSHHKVNLSQRVGTHHSGTRRQKVASSMGRIVQGTHRPRDTLFKGSKILDRDTLFTDTSSCHHVNRCWLIRGTYQQTYIYQRFYIFSEANFWEQWIENTQVLSSIAII